MDTAVVASPPAEPVPINSGRRRRPSKAEAEAALQTRGAAVVIEAAHQCMTTRGTRKPGVSMATSRRLGSFRDDPATRREFLAMIGSPRSAPHES